MRCSCTLSSARPPARGCCAHACASCACATPSSEQLPLSGLLQTPGHCQPTWGHTQLQPPACMLPSHFSCPWSPLHRPAQALVMRGAWPCATLRCSPCQSKLQGLQQCRTDLPGTCCRCWWAALLAVPPCSATAAPSASCHSAPTPCATAPTAAGRCRGPDPAAPLEACQVGLTAMRLQLLCVQLHEGLRA